MVCYSLRPLWPIRLLFFEPTWMSLMWVRLLLGTLNSFTKIKKISSYVTEDHGSTQVLCWFSWDPEVFFRHKSCSSVIGHWLAPYGFKVHYVQEMLIFLCSHFRGEWHLELPLSARPFSFCVSRSSKSIWPRVLKCCSACVCAHLYLRVDIFIICRVISLDLATVWNVALHVKLCTWGCACGLILISNKKNKKKDQQGKGNVHRTRPPTNSNQPRADKLLPLT
jgi:hypothetical protein